MKLYYSPGACSLASHIILREIGQPFGLERVDLASKTTETGADYTRITDKGQVPALEMPDGGVLTEGAAILQFIADHAGATQLAPQAGSVARARVQEMLNFCASELHKAFGPLFNAEAPQAAKDAAPAAVARHFDWLEKRLGDGRAHLTGAAFTVADAYIFVVAGWAGPTGIGFDRWPNLAAFLDRVRTRPTVKAALAAEGLA